MAAAAFSADEPAALGEFKGPGLDGSSGAWLVEPDTTVAGRFTCVAELDSCEHCEDDDEVRAVFWPHLAEGCSLPPGEGVQTLESAWSCRSW
ncbi:hypothetical protein MTO96_035819 [Rhipicephalus appendiculatus]